ncbi:GDYXXLXY domain-containing protein [Patescibacteria group bacterium]|nr:GDYXXLXY domain-containing protein [Patescibacteria group bacterium]MBU1123241.1 GDYXXLXY domain-containing protein [Patescibacteria group bacterium]MBU1911620.1 GDYXXLXY domain-containing protein [Patescibacteria group bacterium]
MKKTYIAIGIQLAIMVLVLIPPLLVMATGKVVYLETDKMDPRSMFRGHFAILGYLEAQDVLSKEIADESRRTGKPVYVQFTTDRPAKFVSVGIKKPKLSENTICIIGRARGHEGFGAFSPLLDNESVDFPQIAQYFTSKEEAQAVESARGEDLLAKVKVTGGCNAQLVGMELR